MTDFAVKLLVRSDTTFRGEYVKHNVGESSMFTTSVCLYFRDADSNVLSFAIGRVPNISSFRSRDAGMALRPQVQTIIDTVRYFQEQLLLEETAPMSCTIA